MTNKQQICTHAVGHCAPLKPIYMYTREVYTKLILRAKSCGPDKEGDDAVDIRLPAVRGRLVLVLVQVDHRRVLHIQWARSVEGVVAGDGPLLGSGGRGRGRGAVGGRQRQLRADQVVEGHARDGRHLSKEKCLTA